MTLGALGYIGFGVESTEGTAVSPTKFLPVSAFDIEDRDDDTKLEQIRHGRDYEVSFPAPFTVSGSLDMELIPCDTIELLKSAFAASITTSAYAGGGYQHVITPGNVVYALSFEQSAGDLLIMRYAGVRANTLSIKGAYGEAVTMNVGLEGLSRAKIGPVNPPYAVPTPSYTVCVPFNFAGAVIKTASGTTLTNVKDFEFTVNNNSERMGALNKTRGWRRIAYGLRDVGLTLTLDLKDNSTDMTEIDRFLAGTSTDVELYLEAPAALTYGDATHTNMGSNIPRLKINIPQVKWNKSGVPTSANAPLEATLEATITKPSSAAIFTATLVNNEVKTIGSW